MVRADIVGGLKIALSKGQSLQSAMQSFYNSGYKKEDIEIATRALKTEGFQPRVVQQQVMPRRPMQVKQQPHLTYQAPIKTPATFYPAVQQPVKKPIQIQAHSQVQNTVPMQIVSNYDQPKNNVDIVTIILVAILVILIGVLAGVFFFKEQLVEFLNGFLE